MRKCAWIFILAVVAVTQKPLLADAYRSVQLLTSTNQSIYDSGASSINNRGEILGGLQDDPFLTHSLYWTSAESDSTDLTGASSFGAVGGLNDHGEIAGTLWTPDGRQATAVKMSASGSCTSLQDLPGTLGSWAKAINANGQVAGSAVVDVHGIDENWAVMWSASGVATKIASSSTGPCEARAINSSGMIVGIATIHYGYSAFAYNSITNICTTLPLLAGTYWAQAFGINDSGYVVGLSGNHAVMWTPSGEVVDLSQSHNSAAAYGINSHGMVVGELDGQAVVWDADGSFTVLDTSLSSAYSINDIGQIVGSVSLPQGHSRAMLWQPVPEPSSLVALAGGLGGLALIRRRRIH